MELDVAAQLSGGGCSEARITHFNPCSNRTMHNSAIAALSAIAAAAHALAA
jgi:hypothetical protein